MSSKARYIRYLVLLLILLVVASHESWVKYKVASWDDTLEVRIYAINGDGRNTTERYMDKLQTIDFNEIEKFVNNEAKRHGIAIEAVKLTFGGELYDHPPQPPVQGSALDNILWSLQFRFWALYWQFTADSSHADINLFVNYFDLEKNRALQHSVGLRGGLIGLINAFASKDYQGSNNVVIAHELMHTFGASDKYGPDGEPVYPEGYADAYQDPLYPQSRAEIMGGRIALSQTKSKMPEGLSNVAVGVITALELNWPTD